MTWQFLLETIMKAGCPTTTLTSHGGGNMWETLRFKETSHDSHYSSISHCLTPDIFIKLIIFPGGVGQVPLPLCVLHRGGAILGPKRAGSLSGRGAQVRPSNIL